MRFLSGKKLSGHGNPDLFPEPNPTVKELEPLLGHDARILEVGCGEGQNVLYLAKKGFRYIDAFDCSEAGIAKLKKHCEIRRVNINAFVQDLRTFRFDRKYDFILSFATLCFVKKDEWKRFLHRAMENTDNGGIHLIHLFTDSVPASPDIAPFAAGLAKDGELKTLYEEKAWEILRFQSYEFEDEHPGVPKHIHAVNKIAARKNE